jgi:hypothetical protein
VSWHGATAASAALLAQQGASAPLAGFTLPPGLAAAGLSAPLAVPVAGSASGASMPLAMLNAGAYGLDVSGASHSTPLPLLRSASASSAALPYPVSGPLAPPPGLLAYPQPATGVYGNSPYSGSPPDAAMHGLRPSSAAPAGGLPQPPPDASLCALSLATPEQVALVAGHAGTLSALSGAAFWLAPTSSGCGAPVAPGLALSGSPAQVEAAADLVGQLLALRGATVPAAACWP